MNEENQRGPLLSAKEPPSPARRLNRFIPFFLAFMLILSLVPMFVYPDPTFYTWINSPTVKGYYGLFGAVVYIVFALIVWQKNRAGIPLRYGLMFLWVLFFTIVVAFIHESQISYSDANGVVQSFALPSFDRLIYEAETPVAVRNSSMLFSELLKEWLESAKPRLEETTYSGYWKCIYKIVAPYFDALKTKASELTPEDIEEFYRQAQPGRKANTLIHYHAVIREALQWGLRKRIVTQNVADLVQKPKKEPFMPNYYTLDDMKELLEKVKGTQLELAVFLGCHYGLRREEIIGLKWDAIDFQYHKINIKHIVTEAQIDGHYKRISMDRAKTQKSLRSLPMDKTVEDFMMDYKAKQDEWKQNFKGKYDHSYDGYVYLWPDGHRVIPSWITATFHDFLKANFPSDKIIRFHDLRHSCASLLRHEGVPMEDIQKWLGHSTIVTTEGLYAHFDQNGNIGSANKLASAFGEQGVDPVKTDPPHM